MKKAQTETTTETTETTPSENNLSLFFKGLVLLHRGEAHWRAWFPDIEDHDLAIRITKMREGKSSDFLVPTGSTIEIEMEIESQSTDDGSFRANILDVNEPNLHRDGLKVRDDNDDEISKLKFTQDINLFPFGDKQTFDIWRCAADGDTKQRVAIDKKADKEVFATFRCKAGSTTKIKITGPIKTEFTLPHDETSQYKIEFDNDCDSLGCATSSDYHFYYTLIDIPDTEDKFELIQKSLNPMKGPEPMCDVVIGTDLDYTLW